MVPSFFQYVEGLGNFPADWSMTDADTITTKITKGTTPPKSEIVEESKIPFLRVNNLGFNGLLKYESEMLFVSEGSHNGFLARSIAYPNDILMNIVGPPLGKIAMLDSSYPEYNMNQAIVIYRCNQKLVNEHFFIKYLSSELAQQWLQSRSKKTSGQQNLTIQLCKELPVPIPPLPEQQKIAKILSTWDKAIATTEKLISTSQQQKKALIQQLLTGKTRLVNPETGKAFEGDRERHSLSDLVHVDKTSLGKKTADDFEFRYISLSDVAIGTISVNLEVHKYATAPSRARRVLQNGDILLSTVRPNLKGFAKISEKHADCIASTGFSVLTPKKRVSGDYIYQYIFSSHVTGQIDSLVVGSNYPAINSSDVAGLKIYCPAYEEQQKIASVLTAADKEIELLQAKLAHLKDEKKALMQQLLTGKRRVKVDEVKVA